jgi:3'(2'), 5'-bisphosphate nucleotidase
VIIGLLEEGLSKCGVIYRPVGDVLYAGACDEATWIVTGAGLRRARVSRAVPPHLVRLAVSRSHRHPIIDRIKAGLGNVSEIACGSVGAKIGLLVSGKADAYVEPSPPTRASGMSAGRKRFCEVQAGLCPTWPEGQFAMKVRS